MTKAPQRCVSHLRRNFNESEVFSTPSVPLHAWHETARPILLSLVTQCGKHSKQAEVYDPALPQ